MISLSLRESSLLDDVTSFVQFLLGPSLPKRNHLANPIEFVPLVEAGGLDTGTPPAERIADLQDKELASFGLTASSRCWARIRISVRACLRSREATARRFGRRASCGN